MTPNTVDPAPARGTRSADRHATAAAAVEFERRALALLAHAHQQGLLCGGELGRLSADVHHATVRALTHPRPGLAEHHRVTPPR